LRQGLLYYYIIIIIIIIIIVLVVVIVGQGIFYCRVHGSALHMVRCIAGRETHADFADESADNVWNEGN
jgi:flagellar basal body-associated protein FliL